MNRYRIIVIVLMVILSACTTNKAIVKHDELAQYSDYRSLAKEKYGVNVEFNFNSDSTFVLCQKVISRDALNPNQVREFFVFDTKNNRIIYEDKMANAKVAWYNKTQLLITRRKGFIEDEVDTGKRSYVLDLYSKNKIIQP
ncbi:hypothetical protein [Marinifilum sp.]|uniref:hypothetical protein n=1 Tax=Marinifilum sp. TaxID=2033137 RepID=UPI003BA9C563